MSGEARSLGNSFSYYAVLPLKNYERSVWRRASGREEANLIELFCLSAGAESKNPPSLCSHLVLVFGFL